MRRMIAVSVVVAAAATIVSLALLERRPAGPQYTFLICLDAVRPDHMSCYGYAVKTTPRIDELAAQGTVFEDAISQAPWTTPSIATILSSSFPCQHGARRGGGAGIPYGGLASNFIETLGSLGYETALFTGGIAIKEKVPGADLTDGALKWLRNNLDKQCFIVIHDYETHSPYIATPDCIAALDPGYEGPYKLSFGNLDLLKKARVGRLGDAVNLTAADTKHIKALYDCQIRRADAAIGALVDSLLAWNRLKRSMIVVFADHGEEFLEHGSIDHGQTVYEESIKVPLIIYCPSVAPKPERVRDQVGLIDIAPTIFDILGIQKPATFEGVSLAPFMSSRFTASPGTTRPCGLPVECLVAESIARRSEKKALRRPPWKLIFDPFFGAVELYDLSKDPHETMNVIDANPEVASRLTETLLVMQKYYPGGWCMAWRGDNGRRVKGEVAVDGSLVEAVAHNFFPEIDVRTDTLATTEDWKTARFATTSGDQWKGIEVRMAEPADATINLTRGDSAPLRANSLRAVIGKSGKRSQFPIPLSPDRARIERGDLRDLFLRQDSVPGSTTLEGPPGEDWNCVIYWLEPGSEPAAKAAKDKELRKQLKAIGYIE